MKRASTLVMIVTAALLMASPASAYDFYMTQWNTTELNTAGDSIHVVVSGNTITFTWVDGNATGPSATNLQQVWWSTAVHTLAGLGTATGYTTSDPCGNQGPNHDQCTADGFGQFRAEGVDDDSSSGSRQTSITFTFDNSLDSTSFTAEDFALHVQYSNSCSGYVDGSIDAGSINPNSNCTPVPEPLTMFLGGTGLFALGYAGRKRLFGRFAR